MMETTLKPDSGKLRERYRRVMDKVAEAATQYGRPPESIVVVAVTDQASPDQIRQMVELGHVDLGETTVAQLPQRALQLQEFLGRRRFLTRLRPRPEGEGASHGAAGGAQGPSVQVPAAGANPAGANPQVRWHLLGPVPKNKIKPLVSLVRLIHSIDNLRVAEDLHAFAGRLESPGVEAEGAAAERPTRQPVDVLDVLLQVNVLGDPQVSGVVAPAAIHLAEQIDSMVNLRLRGLCINTRPGMKPGELEMTFARGAELYQDLLSEKIGGRSFNILAMGEDHSFEAAVAAGANLVSIGQAIFGGGEA
ncbi:MAG: hypothetical protein IT443_01120 [Phycisphaeraceae bacterium]|nr:hypothetical protein [Phycisphaeraceae bacterium]